MSICPKCNGAGVVVLDNGRKAKCNFCFGRGMTDRLLEQTNEEYLRSCDTEQLADVLESFYWKGINDDADNEGFKSEEYFVNWLKEVHKE